MKRLLSLVLIASLLFAQQAIAAPKKIKVEAMQLLTTVGTPDEVSGVVTSGKSLVIFGSKASKAYARAIDSSGKELWSLSLDQAVASIATAAAVDSAGNIWIAGATPLAMGLTPPTSTITPVNPDNASVPPSVLIGDLRVLTIWKIAASGTLIFTNTLPTSFVLFPTAITVDQNGASTVGIMGSEKGNAGFLVNADNSGLFSKLAQIGASSTTADGVVRHGDGSFTVVGSSAETLAGKKVAGITDGFLAKISKTLKITNLVRSSAANGKRIWNSTSSTLLLGGEVVVAGKTEAAITKFSSSYVPTWSYRFLSTGATFTLGSTHALFMSTAATPQLNWKPKAPTPLLLSFDAKGKIVAADHGPVGQKEVLGALLSKEFGLLVLTSSPESVSIFTLIPR